MQLLPVTPTSPEDCPPGGYNNWEKAHTHKMTTKDYSTNYMLHEGRDLIYFVYHSILVSSTVAQAGLLQ